MSDLRDAARQALETMRTNAYAVVNEAPHQDVMAYYEAIASLVDALEQPERPNFTLSCGCPSQYGGVPAYWDRDGGTAFGMICEKHWHEYDARGQA